MDRNRLLTAGVTILAAGASVGLMIYNESQYQSALDRDPVAVATVSPAPTAAGTAAPAVSEPASPPPAVAAALPLPSDPVAIQLPEVPARPAAPARAAPDNTAELDQRLPVLPRDRALNLAPLPTDTGLARRIARLGLSDVSPADGTSDVQRNSFGVPCGVTASSSAARAGLIALTVTAPCRPNASITVRHSELVFTDVTNALGIFKAEVPALVSPADIRVEFRDGSEAVTTVDVPDLAAVSRAVLQWQGVEGLQIHAMEYGATYGEAGHVWSGAPREAGVTVTGDGGFLTVLGDGSGLAPRMAEVYTFPDGAAQQKGVVRLSIEAEVTPINCGGEIEAETIQIDGLTPPAAVALTLAMPGCEAVGEFLVLKNVLRDLRIAAR